MLGDPLTIYFYALYNISNHAFFAMYSGINVYIWPQTASYWCLVPNIAWTIAIWFLNQDKHWTLIGLVIYTYIEMLIKIIMAEEVMLHVHRQEIPGCENWGSYNVHVKMNHDLKYIAVMLWINIQETFFEPNQTVQNTK